MHLNSMLLEKATVIQERIKTTIKLTFNELQGKKKSTTRYNITLTVDQVLRKTQGLNTQKG